MNKEEILSEIEKTKEHLANMEKMLEECEYARWKPNKGDIYYFVDGDLEVIADWWSTIESQSNIYNAYNYFQTEKEAKQEAEKILIRRQLEAIARRLNKGKQITWSTVDAKYFLYINCDGKINTNFNSCIAIQGVVYCLDKSFEDVAIQQIGEERLKNYLRGE